MTEEKLYSRENPIPLDAPIEELGLSPKVVDCLKGLHDFSVVGDITSKTADQLLSHSRFGKVRLREVENKLRENGRSLSPEQRTFITIPRGH